MEKLTHSLKKNKKVSVVRHIQKQVDLYVHPTSEILEH